MKGCARVGGFLHLPLNMERLAKLTGKLCRFQYKVKAGTKYPVYARQGQRGIKKNHS